MSFNSRRLWPKCGVVCLLAILLLGCAGLTPTPEPTATPAVVRATKPEHLAGTWLVPWDHLYGTLYVRFEGDGTMCEAYSQQESEECSDDWTRFWFEDGVYYEDFGACQFVGAYRAYLHIKGGRAVGLAFERIYDPDVAPGCMRQKRMLYEFVRVD